MSKFDFSHLSKADQKNAPRPFEIIELEDEPTIHFRPATKANPAYWNEVMKRADSGLAAKQVRQAKKSKGYDPVREKQVQADDAESFGKYCATGWEGVCDAKGKPVEFSQEAVIEYLTALPDFIMQRLRGWITNPMNFVDSDPVESGREVGKSSPDA